MKQRNLYIYIYIFPFLFYKFLMKVSFSIAGCSQKNNLDIAFIVDSSSSLSTQDFEDTKMFIRSVLGKFDIGLNKTRVALIKYR